MIPTEDGFPPRLTAAETAELTRRRKGRNRALLVVLIGLALLFYAIAMVKFKVS